MILVTVRHIITASPLFVVSTVGRTLWNEISNELVTTRLKKKKIPSPPLPYKCYTQTKAGNWASRDSGIEFCIFLKTKNQNIINMLHKTRDIHN
jgi:hypothetical protein